eukprot:m.97893 g.97893  ORF g.97893 m.97893 type:complete len:582 (+) comp13113_c1_seq2:2686-4431(+)
MSVEGKPTKTTPEVVCDAVGAVFQETNAAHIVRTLGESDATTAGALYSQPGRRVIASKSLGVGDVVVSQRGVSVPMVHAMASTCPVCFSTDGTHADGEDVCKTLATLLAPFEHSLYTQLQGIKQMLHVSDTMLRLWLRVIALCNLGSQPSNKKALEYIKDWMQALQGMADLMTSAPDQGWLMDVVMSAMTFTQALKPVHVAEFEKQIGKHIAKSQQLSPSGTAAEGTRADADAAADAAASSEGVSAAEALALIAGQMNRNGYSLRDLASPNKTISIGIYPAIAMVNHSCSPNCAVVSTPGGTVTVRALRPIAAGDEVTVSYVDLLQPRAQRRAELMQTKEFTCHCLRCDVPDAFAGERTFETALCEHCRRNVPRTIHLAAAEGGKETGSQRDALVCHVDDGGCGRVCSLESQQSRLEDAALLLATLESDMRQAIKSANKVEAVDGASSVSCQEVLVALNEALDGLLATTIPRTHHLALKAYSLQHHLASQTNDRLASASALKRSIDGMASVLPANWLELCEWQTRFVETVQEATTNGAKDSTMLKRLQKVVMTFKPSLISNTSALCGQSHPFHVRVSAAFA